MESKCRSAYVHRDGWYCNMTDEKCEFLHPDSKRCAEMYGMGPDAQDDYDDIPAPTAYNNDDEMEELDEETREEILEESGDYE